MIEEMALRRYGYGRWQAPFWFIGPEEAKARDEDIQIRLQAWLSLGNPEVCDCKEFHDRIKVRKWHQPPPPLQPTWRRLMLLLLSFQDKSADQRSLRLYQMSRWGAAGGDTCVLELSGLPAHSYSESRKQKIFEQSKSDEIRRQRIAHIQQQIAEHPPRFVVMYG
ncbi:MAG: hypothetical protein WBD46_11940, partial [Acidobacteriaceae bacterium]